MNITELVAKAKKVEELAAAIAAVAQMRANMDAGHEAIFALASKSRDEWAGGIKTDAEARCLLADALRRGLTQTLDGLEADLLAAAADVQQAAKSAPPTAQA